MSLGKSDRQSITLVRKQILFYLGLVLFSYFTSLYTGQQVAAVVGFMLLRVSSITLDGRGLVGIGPYKLSLSHQMLPNTFFRLLNQGSVSSKELKWLQLSVTAVIDHKRVPQFQTEMETGYSSSPTTKKCSPGSITIKPTSLALERCSQGLNTNPTSALSPAFSFTLWKPTSCLTGLPLLGFFFLVNSNTGCFPAIFPLFFMPMVTKNFFLSQSSSPSSETNLASGVCVAFDG